MVVFYALDCFWWEMLTGEVQFLSDIMELDGTSKATADIVFKPFHVGTIFSPLNNILSLHRKKYMYFLIKNKSVLVTGCYININAAGRPF